MSECYEILGTVINPLIETQKGNIVVMTVEVGSNIYNIMINEIKYIEIKEPTKVTIKLTKYALIKDVEEITSFESDKPLIITSYPTGKINNHKLIETLNLYSFDNQTILDETESQKIVGTGKIYKKQSGKFTKEIKLPYEGIIKVSPGEKLSADTIFGTNNHDFPKIYILSLAKLLANKFGSIDIRNNLLVREGDIIKYDQNLIDFAVSPVRGIVKMINYDTGTILVREHQDYHEKPMKVPVAKLLRKKPSSLRTYLRVRKGEFVFEDENLVALARGANTIVRAPNTGYVTDINYEKGDVTIQYIRKPVNYPVQLNCQVIDTENRKKITIEYEAIEYQGVIGFGKSNFGKLLYLQDLDASAQFEGNIIVLDKNISVADLKYLENQKISGLIIAGIEMKDIVEFIGKEIGVALTGNEDIPYPIIIMNGFGRFKISPEFVADIKKNIGKNCLLSPTTQIRAGVTRPKVIIN